MTPTYRALSATLLLCLGGCATTQDGSSIAATDAVEPDAQETTEVISGPVLPRPEGPVPIRLPAQVLRVWIAPWEDAHGDLHAPGFVYTEVVPRRWSLGEPASAMATQRITPLQVQHRSEGTSTPRPSRPAPAEPARPPAPPSTPRPEAAAGP
jgi:conjugal transfer pilus assembly protein TraV